MVILLYRRNLAAYFHIGRLETTSYNEGDCEVLLIYRTYQGEVEKFNSRCFFPGKGSRCSWWPLLNRTLSQSVQHWLKQSGRVASRKNAIFISSFNRLEVITWVPQGKRYQKLIMNGAILCATYVWFIIAFRKTNIRCRTKVEIFWSAYPFALVLKHKLTDLVIFIYARGEIKLSSNFEHWVLKFYFNFSNFTKSLTFKSSHRMRI